MIYNILGFSSRGSFLNFQFSHCKQYCVKCLGSLLECFIHLICSHLLSPQWFSAELICYYFTIFFWWRNLISTCCLFLDQLVDHQFDIGNHEMYIFFLVLEVPFLAYGNDILMPSNKMKHQTFYRMDNVLFFLFPFL